MKIFLEVQHKVGDERFFINKKTNFIDVVIIINTELKMKIFPSEDPIRETSLIFKKRELLKDYNFYSEFDFKEIELTYTICPVYKYTKCTMAGLRRIITHVKDSENLIFRDKDELFKRYREYLLSLMNNTNERKYTDEEVENLVNDEISEYEFFSV